MSAISLPLPLPRPSQIGVGLKGVHPKASQIGVDFRDSASIGVEFRGFAFPITRVSGDVGDSRASAAPSPSLFIPLHPRSSQFGVGSRCLGLASSQ